jgi:hypothetical protein
VPSSVVAHRFEHDDLAVVDGDVVRVEPFRDLVVAGSGPPALDEVEGPSLEVVAGELFDALAGVEDEGVLEVERADGDFRFVGVAREDDRPARSRHRFRVRLWFWEREWILEWRGKGEMGGS